MGLCSWSIICMNVPGSKESKWTVIWRKFALSALAIVCRELLLSIAASQWVRARRCVQEFHSLDSERDRTDADGNPTDNGYPATAVQQSVNKKEHRLTITAKDSSADGDRERENFDMPMGFYADTGGFRLKLKSGESFPANAKAISWLISEKLIRQPLFRPLLVDDKNKVDFLLRVITLLQIASFLMSTVARWAQHLFITTAELTTISFIACSILTASYWWHKPCDVLSPEIIEIDVSIEELEKRCKPNPGYRWELTPIDWVTREEWWWSKVWWSYLNVARWMGISFGSDTKPVDRIADTYQGPLPRKQQYMMLVVSTGCFVIFFLGWHHEFPTWIELVFWRITCVLLMSILYIYVIISEMTQAYEALYQRTRSRNRRAPTLPLTRWTPRLEHRHFQFLLSPKVVARIDEACEKIRNNSPNNDPSVRLPLKVILPLYILASIYFFCRGYILIEDAIELRQLPKSAYSTVDWQKFWPHLG
ncbi:MAG: hypothetical protein Q9219_007333 [cf. Caloplaca sp. 3 TL-2023]